MVVDWKVLTSMILSRIHEGVVCCLHHCDIHKVNVGMQVGRSDCLHKELPFPSLNLIIYILPPARIGVGIEPHEYMYFFLHCQK